MWKSVVVTVLLAATTLGAETFSKNLINKNVERIIDLSTQLVKVTTTITLENAGKDVETNFHLIPEPEHLGSLSHVSVKDALKQDLKVHQVKVDGKTAYRVNLRSNLAAGRTANVVVEYVYTHALESYPSSITQKDKQLVRYFGDHYWYSPYKTSKQTTAVTLASKNIESYSKLKPVSQTESTIKYGPYSDIDAFGIDQMIIHYENNSPFLTVTRLDRLIEISHWGNIAVQEDIEILHTGAKLKGSFSRYDYQRDTSTTHHSIKSYKTVLPAAAHSIYYRDSNGNISTSQVRTRKDWIELELRPRFPLFGGWRSSYTLGYSVPSYQYLYKLPNGNYKLNMRLLDHVFDDMQVDELETSIVLPVGVQNVQVSYPFEVTKLDNEVAHKFLDTIGRQVIKLKKTDLVEQHIQDMEIVYEWSPHLLFHEPILISIALYAMFLICIIYVRLDFSIHSKKEEHSKKD